MPVLPTRRQLVLHAVTAITTVAAGGAFGAATVACGPPPRVHDPTARGPGNGAHSFAAIEARVGGRLGVFALDTGDGRELAHRADERFAMCSTFKWVLAAAILAKVDRGALALDDRVPYGERDLLEHAPTAREHLAEGAMTIDALAQAAVLVSDNTAANLLLAQIDGPAGLTRFIRAHGDEVTRLDRDEPALNDVTPGDPRDTTSPRAMVALMRALLCEDALSPASRERLLQWLRACETGKRRLRAGLPPGFIAGDKTGTGPSGSVNDVAIVWPPPREHPRAPLLVATYIADGKANLPDLEAAHADVGRLVAHEL